MKRPSVWWWITEVSPQIQWGISHRIVAMHVLRYFGSALEVASELLEIHYQPFHPPSFSFLSWVDVVFNLQENENHCSTWSGFLHTTLNLFLARKHNFTTMESCLKCDCRSSQNNWVHLFRSCSPARTASTLTNSSLTPDLSKRPPTSKQSILPSVYRSACTSRILAFKSLVF